MTKIMKYIGLTLLIIIWMLSTIILAITFVGLVVFFIEDEDLNSYWFEYGRRLIEKMLN